MTDFLQSVCRLLTFVLLWGGIARMAPATLPLWAHVALYLGAGVASEYGWIGKIRL